MAKSEKYKTFENLPACAAEFIKLVIKNMSYRRSAHREIAEELTDHFEEHLKDCKNSVEKEQKARLLINEFGDAKLLGRLMRRAKKRCRPLWRIAIERTCQAIFTLIIFLILYVAWFLTGKPVITTDYIAELNKLVRPSADDSLNAAPLYLKAAEALVDINDVAEFLRFDFYDANNNQKELMRQWLAKNETPLAFVAKGSQLPYFWKQYRSGAPNQGMIGILLPDLPLSRAITYALCWRAWLNAEDGDFNSAFRDIETCYRFGRHNKGEKMLVEQLVGMHIEGRALHTTRQLLDTYKTDSNTLADFQRRLRLLIDNDDFTMNLQVEKLFMLDEIQRCFTESRFGLTHLYPRRIVEIADLENQSDASIEQKLLINLCLALTPGLLSQNWPWIFSHPDKAESIAAANALYKFWDEIASKTPARLNAEDINLAAETDRMIKNNLLLRILSPALERVNIIAWRIKIDAESTLLIIALVRFKQDRGDYPETLDKLVETGYINHILTDPFSDAPLIYKKTEEEALLYSWGENFTDDDGQVARDKKDKLIQWANEGDSVFWPVIKN